MTDNSKPVTKRAGTRKPKTKPPRPDHDQIAELAYLIHLEEGTATSSHTGFAPSVN